MSDKIITILLTETVLDETTYGGMTSIAIQENNQDTVDLIEQAANELVVGVLENTCQSAMIVDDSGIKLIRDLMRQVENTDWTNCLYCVINTLPTSVRFSIESGYANEETSILSSELRFIVKKSDVASVKNSKAATVEGMTKESTFNF